MVPCGIEHFEVHALRFLWITDLKPPFARYFKRERPVFQSWTEGNRFYGQ